MNEKAFPVVIIGGGPAGLTAAIYSARAGFTPLVIEGGPPNLPGGQLMITTDVENFPGFAEPVMGPDLVMAMRAQAERAGAKFLTASVEKVALKDRPFELTIEDGSTITAETIIIATGASAKWLGLPEETTLAGKGISACATCDGFFFRGKDVIVVGGGDTALEEATYLARLAGSVTIIHRREKFRASVAMQERAKQNPKIKLVLNSVVSKILDPAEGKVTGAIVKNTITGKEQTIKADGFFVAIGHQPNTSLFEGQLEIDPNGYIITSPNSPATSVEGVYAAGDVQDTEYKQAVTAAGSGCMAALKAVRFLEEQG